MAYHSLWVDLRRLIKRAGLEDEVRDTFHIFRRTWAAMAVRQGVPRLHVQAIAGWNSTAMLDRYTAEMAAEEGAVEEFKQKFKPFGY